MKLTPFPLDRRLYELLQEKRSTQFTTASLRKDYTSCLGPGIYLHKEVNNYIDDVVRSMVSVGWLSLDDESSEQEQTYRLLPMPEHLQLKLLGKKSEKILRPDHKKNSTCSEFTKRLSVPEAETKSYQKLEEILKEVRLDFLTSIGETERYKQLVTDMPHLHSYIENEYQDAKDRSSRLLGHLRAVEKTLGKLFSK